MKEARLGMSGEMKMSYSWCTCRAELTDKKRLMAFTHHPDSELQNR